MKYNFLWLLYLSFGSAVFCQTQNTSIDDTSTIILDLTHLLVEFKTDLNETKCNEDLREMVKGIARGDSWALNMSDATGKMPAGMSRAAHIFLGQFDECMNIKHTERNFIGQYCLIWFNLTDLVPYIPKIPYVPIFAMYQLGMCLPSSCSPDYLNRTMNSMFIPLMNESLTDLATIKVYDDQCQTSNSTPPYTIGDYSLLAVIALILLLTTMSTCYELHFLKNYLGKPNHLFTSFSLYSNTKSLLRVEKNPNHIGCFQGLRAISMAWVVYAHMVLTVTYSPVLNPFEEIKFGRGPWALMINNAHENVDTFFIMGGFLVMISFMREVQRTGGFDILMSYFKRYIRLTVVLAFLLVLQITLLNHMGRGPLMPAVQTIQNPPCEEKWYRLLFYYQNYVVDGPLCFGQSWYLAMDMQLFWLSPILLYPGIWWPRFGAFLALIMAWVITAVEFYIGYVNDLGPSITHTREPTHLTIDHYTTHTRSAPWFLGVLLGYILLYVRSQKNFKMSKRTVILGWLISMTIFWGNFFALMAFDGNYTQPGAALCLSLRRIGWSIGVIWIVLACSTGYGGIVDWILSWGPFHFLGKLSYNVFLVHFMVLHQRIGLVKDEDYLSASKNVFNFAALYTIMNVVSIPLTLLIEYPCANLTTVLLRNRTIFRIPQSPPELTQIKKEMEKHLRKQSMSIEKNVPSSSMSEINNECKREIEEIPGTQEFQEIQIRENEGDIKLSKSD